MKNALYIVISLLLLGCGTKKPFTEQDHQAFENLQAIVNAKRLEITSNWARPMVTTAFMQVANTNILGPGNTASSINLTSNSNSLKVKGDTISGYFPYFGEVQFGGGYANSNHQGIEFKDIPEDYTVTVNDDKHTVELNFKIADQYRSNERYNVFITLFQNKRSSIQINSTNRTSIEYTGSIDQLKEDTK
jgi:hypothetical protein